MKFWNSCILLICCLMWFLICLQQAFDADRRSEKAILTLLAQHRDRLHHIRMSIEQRPVIEPLRTVQPIEPEEVR